MTFVSAIRIRKFVASRGRDFHFCFRVPRNRGGPVAPKDDKIRLVNCAGDNIEDLGIGDA